MYFCLKLCGFPMNIALRSLARERFGIKVKLYVKLTGSCFLIAHMIFGCLSGHLCRRRDRSHLLRPLQHVPNRQRN